MLIFWAVLGGFVLDAIFADPAWLPHPVVLMGRCISALEKRLRTALPTTPQGELLGGGIVAAVLSLGTLLVTGAACWLVAKLHPALGLALQMFWCGQALAAKGLKQESMNVYKELQKGDLPAARKAVARIVGRDTQSLTAEGVTKAAVETVAENASDGVIAPLFYMLIGGAPLALTYKAINTMDSMLGYKNEKYLYFGRCAAKLDDVANWQPSRLAGLLWVAAAALTGGSAAGAWKIWRRDRRNHASPNSAQTESACAGAINENAFASACVRCGQCVQACPYDTLKLATLASGLSAGTPYFVARDIPCEMCEDIPCAKVCPSGALDREIESIDDARMGLAVLVDQENCLNFQGLRCDVCYRECPKIDEAITLELERNTRTGKHARFLPTVHSDACTGCGKCEKVCVLEQPAIKVLPLSLAKGELGHHYRFGWLEGNNGKS